MTIGTQIGYRTAAAKRILPILSKGLTSERDKADEEEEREVIVFLWFIHDIKSLCWEVSGVRKDKLNPKAANLIGEALDADERTERFLRQMIPSIGLQEKVADEDYEAPQEP